MTLKLLCGAVALALGLSLSVPIVLAAELPPPPPLKPLTVPELITHYSGVYGVSREKLYATLKCESNLYPGAIGDGGTSYGVAQIHLPAHPSITKAQALDPDFAVRFAAKQFSLGHQAMWSCYTILFT